MSKKYATLADAQADGWMTIGDARRHMPGKPLHVMDLYPPIGEERFSDPGRWLSVADVSGGRCYGYHFAVVLSSQDWLGGKQPHLLNSETVWFTEERNKINRLGAFREMFRRDELDAVIAQYPYIPPTPIREVAAA